MEISQFCPPADATFHIGLTDSNTKKSLENIARRKKNGGGHRRFNKARPLKSVRVDRSVLQRSIASRSSALRHGKLAEARTGPHSNEFDAVQAAAKKARSSPIITSTLTHTNAGKRRKITSSRCIQHETPYSAASTRNINMPIFFISSISEFTASADEDNGPADSHH